MERPLVPAVAINEYGDLKTKTGRAPALELGIRFQSLVSCALRLSPLHCVVNPAQACCPPRWTAGLPGNTLAQQGNGNDAEYAAECE